ncbi:hypothetical protein EV702DRAFT_1041976 [Suillus placidus]|uniref:Uncharacterized protein n=1 Tax=Suillus placidus TaxID=48579 RepID=A0A9P7A2X3_9AGAM|nr:hypothetical protein EV702DRAFT_1041976 [Suillus placidus]
MFDGTFPRASFQQAVDNDTIYSSINYHRGTLSWKCSSGAAQSHWNAKHVGVKQGTHARSLIGLSTTVTAMIPALMIIPYDNLHIVKHKIQIHDLVENEENDAFPYIILSVEGANIMVLFAHPAIITSIKLK